MAFIATDQSAISPADYTTFISTNDATNDTSIILADPIPIQAANLSAQSTTDQTTVNATIYPADGTSQGPSYSPTHQRSFQPTDKSTDADS